MTILVLIVFVGLGIYVWFFERKPAPEEKKIVIFPDVKQEEITQFQLIYPEKTIVCARKEDDEWEITKPKKFKANDSAIDTILGKLSDLEAKRKITEEAGKLKDYGLEEPEFKVGFVAAKRPQVLLVGEKTPIGGDYYVKTEGSPAIYILVSWKVSGLKKEVKDLRSKKVIDFSPPLVKKLQIQTTSYKLVCVKEEKKWELQKPVVAKADESKIMEILNNLKNAKVEEFVEDEAKDFKEYGLDKPKIKIELLLKDDSLNGVLMGDVAEGKVYIKPKFVDSVYQVSDSLYKDFNLTPFDLRDKTIVRIPTHLLEEIEFTKGEEKITCRQDEDKIWRIMISTTPSEGKNVETEVGNLLADFRPLEASGFIEEEAEDFGKYGLKKPDYKVKFICKETVAEVWLSKREGEVYVRIVPEKAVYPAPMHRCGVYLVKEEIISEIDKIFEK